MKKYFKFLVKNHMHASRISVTSIFKPTFYIITIKSVSKPIKLQFFFYRNFKKTLNTQKTCLDQTPNKQKTCLNQTPNKQKTCLNQTPNKQKTCLNQTPNKQKTCLNQTLNKQQKTCLNQIPNKPALIIIIIISLC